MTSNEYAERAERARAQADAAITPEGESTYLAAAESWELLAEGAERLERSRELAELHGLEV